MAEAKVFPMNAFVSVLRGEAADQTQLDMLAYITQLKLWTPTSPLWHRLCPKPGSTNRNPV